MIRFTADEGTALLEAYDDGSIFGVARHLAEYPQVVRLINELGDDEVFQLRDRVECARWYRQAFPERPPVYALRAAELLHVAEYPHPFTPSVDKETDK